MKSLNVELTPQQIVKELDRYIIGQAAAKRSVAVAMRNRWRRLQVSDHLRDEIYPKNIIMIGATGVGKTEIARRLAKLVRAPFYKVEASKFTEIGYVGKDVESMVRDLLEVGINLVREEEKEGVEERAQKNVEERLLDLLYPPRKETDVQASEGNGEDRTREKLRKLLREGAMDEKTLPSLTPGSTEEFFFVPDRSTWFENPPYYKRHLLDLLFAIEPRQSKMHRFSDPLSPRVSSVRTQG